MLRDRARSAAFLIPPLLVALVLGEPWISLVVVVAVVLAGRETFQLLAAAGQPSFAALGIVLGVIVALGDSVTALPGGSGLLLAAVGIVLVGATALSRPDPREGLATFATTVFGALYVSLLGFVARLSQAPAPVPADAPLGFLGSERAWVLLLILVVWAFDTGSYAVGSRIGRRRFMPHLSPGKTVEGVVGGAIAATLVSCVLVWAVGRPVLAGLPLGLAIVAAAQAGDLAESMLKRAAGAKDSGHLIPGHGGLLDRIDSFLFAAPIAFLYVVSAFR